MELELGLALPNQTPTLAKGLDLNCIYYGVPEMETNNKGYKINNQSSGFLDHEVESKPLSLLLWSGQPSEEDDGTPEKRSQNYQINDEESEEIVGWPPINSLRKELLHRHQGGWNMANNRAAAGRVMAARNSMYVKVKMEGVPIGRKIDLRLCNSYQALTGALIDMFAKYTKKESGDGDYTILYQDRDGDWMLAGDVPWESFVESVQRMEILSRNGD